MKYLKIVAAVLPKQMQLEVLTPRPSAEDLTDDELAWIAAGNLLDATNGHQLA